MQGGQQLKLSATGAQLEQAPAAHGDAAGVTGRAEREQVAQRADARGLDVDHPGRELQRVEIGDAVDRRVPGEAVAMRGEDRLRLDREPGILEPGAAATRR